MLVEAFLLVSTGMRRGVVLTFETNLLRVDGISQLVERMHHILAAARA